MNIEVTILISALSVAFAIYMGIANKKRNDSQDIKKEAIETATINVKLDTISKGIDEIKLDIKSTNLDVETLKERVIKCEQSVKSAHNRLDGVEERILHEKDRI